MIFNAQRTGVGNVQGDLTFDRVEIDIGSGFDSAVVCGGAVVSACGELGVGVKVGEDSGEPGGLLGATGGGGGGIT